MNSYNFQYDFFSHNIPHWEKILTYLNEKFGNNLRCLEVGAFEGKSALYMLDNFVGESNLTVIDYFRFPKIKQTYFNNIKNHPKHNQVRTIEGQSFVELSKLLNEDPFDFIYIDAGKTSADNLFNLIVGERLLREGGIMIVDDFEWAIEGKEIKHTPKLGILNFIDISLLCEVYMKYYQVAFIKNLPNDILLNLNR